MNIAEILVLAVGLSMDAFAVSLCLGLNMEKATFKKSLTVGGYFGFFQAAMPLIGFFAATLFADKIIAFDHWVAFGILIFLGGKMIAAVFKKDEQTEKQEPSLSPAKMLPYALATSIDALAVGVSLALASSEAKIFPAVLTIGIVTLVFSAAGVKIGNLFGTKIKSKAEIAGGVILILIGVKILLEHYGVISF